MHIILGATGNVGSAAMRFLLENGEDVLAITHSAKHLPKLRLAGARAEMVDLHDSKALAKIFSRGETLFLLNPPGDPAKDAVKLESESVRCLLHALKLSSVQRVVAESTQGAQRGEGIGDLGVLFELEEGLKSWGGDCLATRAAYYYSNWIAQAEVVKKTGRLQSFFPSDFQLAMVAPHDIGRFNGQQMMAKPTGFEIKNVSGPRDYSPQDVADEFARIFNRDVTVDVTPPSDWISTYEKLGFSTISAQSFAAMTRITLDRDYDIPTNPVRGSTTLREYLESALIEKPLSQRLLAPLTL